MELNGENLKAIHSQGQDKAAYSQYLFNIVTEVLERAVRKLKEINGDSNWKGRSIAIHIRYVIHKRPPNILPDNSFS